MARRVKTFRILEWRKNARVITIVRRESRKDLRLKIGDLERMTGGDAAEGTSHQRDAHGVGHTRVTVMSAVVEGVIVTATGGREEEAHPGPHPQSLGSKLRENGKKLLSVVWMKRRGSKRRHGVMIALSW